ncbi:MAG: hypothetical protein AAF547_10755 [Actinomycetota bacterium]
MTGDTGKITGEAGDDLLSDIWAAPNDVDVDPDCSPTKVCRNARDFTFDGIADGDDGDLATSWRKLLQREGKFAASSDDAPSIRDLVLGSQTD